MGGKKSSIGTAAGLALGALFALPTGGVSLAAGAAIGGAAGGSVGNIADTSDTNKKIKAATAEANAKEQKAIAELETARSTASSQAQAAVQSRRAKYSSSNTIFSNPLGIAGMASTARKTLLGQ